MSEETYLLTIHPGSYLQDQNSLTYLPENVLELRLKPHDKTLQIRKKST